MSVNSIIEGQNLEISTPDNKVLASNLSFQVQRGEMLVIRGKNGSGKSTLIRTILGLHSHYQGEIRRDYRDEEVTYLPQIGNVQFLFPLTLLDILQLESTQEVIEAVCCSLLELDQLKRLWNTASGGERQKTLLTRTFLSQAPLILLDEPFNHLDPAAKIKVAQHLQDKLLEGCAIILISHDLEPIYHLNFRQLNLDLEPQ